MLQSLVWLDYLKNVYKAKVSAQSNKMEPSPQVSLFEDKRQAMTLQISSLVFGLTNGFKIRAKPTALLAAR